jgi:hypothetical protein
MKLVVERSGGFAGIKRRGERDGQDLSPEQRAALDQVIKESAAPDSEKLSAAQDPGADRFTYRLEVQDDSGTKTITLPESRMPGVLKTIVMP